MNPLRWLLIPPARQALSQRYQYWQQNGASRFAASIQCLWVILCWSQIGRAHV